MKVILDRRNAIPEELGDVMISLGGRQGSRTGSDYSD